LCAHHFPIRISNLRAAMMHSVPLDHLAGLLADARCAGRQIDQLPAYLLPTTADDAYAVNRRVAERLGWETLGWKIAGTTAAVREKLRVPGPIYGRTFRRFAVTSPVTLSHGALLDPLVESEFFVTLGLDLPSRTMPWTMADVIDAVASVHAGIEVAECRFPMAALPPLPAILADGSASGRYVYGDPIADWRAGLAGIRVVLEVDGTARRHGSGAGVMGCVLET